MVLLKVHTTKPGLHRRPTTWLSAVYNAQCTHCVGRCSAVCSLRYPLLVCGHKCYAGSPDLFCFLGKLFVQPGRFTNQEEVDL